MRFIVVAFLFCFLLADKTYAQQDSSGLKNNDTSLSNGGQKDHLYLLDSVAQAIQARDQFVSDSLATMYIKPADPARHNQWVDSLFTKYVYKGNGQFLDIPSTSKSLQKEGRSRQTRDQWVIVIIIGLLLYTAILNRIMSKDFESVWQSFYNKRMLTQVSREDGLINSWTFIGLFLLFGLTFGLFLYQLAAYNHVFYSISGFPLFIRLSFYILGLFALKFLILKFIGFIFNINKLVSEYLSVLYLTYFNIAFVFLPVAVCFSLLTDQLIPYILAIALILIVIIFIWQYLRSSVNIISNILFHKFYLFVYLCALEICPILILIKALNI
ncbi:MAG TPA: DUF4271 domain-containing protein [Mucilaginibacter sp.]|nr:DUF4271 domain-containing protein [Mucilaginibacter sp.]